jgi:hypothetical protein
MAGKLRQTASPGREKNATQALLDTFKAKSLGGKVTGILPINVSFPRIRAVDIFRFRTDQ